MGVTNFPDGVNIGSAAGGTAEFQIGGTAVTLTAADLNALDAASLSATELAYVDAVSPGTVAASKAVVVDANKAIDVLTVTLGTVTTLVAPTATFSGTANVSGALQIGGVAVTASAAELNLIDGSGAGTAVASKALVLGASKDVDVLSVTSGTVTTLTSTTATVSGTANFSGAWQVAGTAVTADAGELNLLDGAVAGTAIASKALALGSSKNVDELTIASGTVTTLNSTTATLGTATATLGTVTTLVAPAATFSGTANVSGVLQLGGTAITATPPQLNAILEYSAADKKIVSGTQVVPAGAAGTAFVPSGLTAAECIVTSLYGPITASNFAFADTSITTGTVTALGYCLAGTASLANGTVSYVAIGT